MTTDPLAHLTAALDAAQRDAEAAGGDAWRLDDIVIRDMVGGEAAEVDRVPDGVVVGADGRGVVAVEHLGHAAGHVLRHDPAAVLRRIAAERRQLARHQPFENLEIVDMPKVGHVTRCAHDKQHWPCPDITDLAEGWGWAEETT
jgi:hypothetical protein